MKFQNKNLNKVWRFFTSFQLGIPVLVVLTVLMIWGTILESMYDAYAAQSLVYSSWMMYLTMGLLVINLAAVMVDRWPWKQKHTPFLLVHIGIITLIFGGWVTQKFGLDGSMMININSKSQHVSVGTTDLVIYATFDGDRYTQFYQKEVDFFKNPPTEKAPLTVPLGEKNLIIKKYLKYARVNKKLLKSTDNNAGASIKFLIQNPNVKQVETLTQPSKNKVVDVNLGPLKLYFGHDPQLLGRKNSMMNEVYFLTANNEQVHYYLFKKEEPKSFKSGLIKIGDQFETGWMGLEIKMLDYLPLATEEWDAVEVDRPTPLTSAALLIQFGEKTQWALLNDVVKLFASNAAYLVSYQNRRIDLGFPVYLKEFKKTNYQGTMKAKEYSSQVLIQTNDPRQEIAGLIQMNEPIKYGGYTFYQSSFIEDEKTGVPTASVLSVNFDPGRAIKYIGSLILSLGIVWLFIQSRKRRTSIT